MLYLKLLNDGGHSPQKGASLFAEKRRGGCFNSCVHRGKLLY